ncbi:MAG: nicotinamide-nucleotide adenylyltransferase [Thermoplasmata archaeon]
MRGLLVGRFQPFHRGHLALVTEIRRTGGVDELMLGVGSAQLSHTPQNPFTSGERIEMVERAVREAGVTSVRAYPLVDVERHAIWVAHVESLVPRFERVYTNNPLTKLLFQKAGYPILHPAWVDRDHFQGSVIRREMLRSDAWRSWVPPAVATYLDEIAAVDRIKILGPGGPSTVAGQAP